MKVCILTYPRTSSSNLFYTLKELTKIKNSIAEPFNRHMWKNRYFNNIDFTNSVELLIKDMFLKEHKPNVFKDMDELLNWYVTTFDKIILLYRENTRLQAESFVYHIELGSSYGWHSQKYYKIDAVNEDKIIDYQNQIIEWNKTLKNISIDYGYPIFKYEDLILNNGDNDSFKEICEYVGCEFDVNIISKRFHHTKKYRLPEPPKNTKLI
jgi:hypothetical protein